MDQLDLLNTDSIQNDYYFTVPPYVILPLRNKWNGTGGSAYKPTAIPMDSYTMVGQGLAVGSNKSVISISRARELSAIILRQTISALFGNLDILA